MGGGYEWMLTPNWTLRGEFLHYWFNQAQTIPINNSGGLPGVSFTNTFTWSRFDVNVARLAVNYKF